MIFDMISEGIVSALSVSWNALMSFKEGLWWLHNTYFSLLCILTNDFHHPVHFTSHTVTLQATEPLAFLRRM